MHGCLKVWEGSGAWWIATLESKGHIVVRFYFFRPKLGRDGRSMVANTIGLPGVTSSTHTVNQLTETI
jgi:hypothetical protein